MSFKSPLAILSAAALVACGSVPPPDWQVAVAASTRQGVDAYLNGNDRVAESAMSRAEREVRRTASVDGLARVQLMRCAAQVAAAQVPTCARASELLDVAPDTRAYAEYLAAAPLSDEALARLPAQQRAAAKALPTEAAKALEEIPDAWSRLVAAGVMWRAQRISLEAVRVAVDTASQQGWTRAVSHWLQIQKEMFQVAGRTQDAERVQRRIDVLLAQ